MSFNNLFGSEKLKNILLSYIRNKNIPNSLILSGPVSANSLDFVKGFAKILNCMKLKNDFCDECQNCVEINKNIFPDLQILMPESQFYKKEQITFLIEDSFKKPLKSSRRIFILCEAHKMNDNSANAFLKVLEEPALGNIFILLTNNLAGLLPTIKSRCQILKLFPPSKSEIKEYFIKIGYREEKARLLSCLSQTYIDDIQLIDFKKFMEKRSQTLLILTKLIVKRGIEDVLLDLYNRSRKRNEFLNYFREMINLISLLLRDIMILKIDKENEFLINIDYKKELMVLSGYLTIEKILFLVRSMENLMRDVQRNLNSRVLILEFIKNYTEREGE